MLVCRRDAREPGTGTRYKGPWGRRGMNLQLRGLQVKRDEKDAKVYGER